MLLITSMMALLYSSHNSVTVVQHEHKDPATEAATWNLAIINFIIYTCDVPTVNCQNVFCEKDLLRLTSLFKGSTGSVVIPLQVSEDSEQRY